MALEYWILLGWAFVLIWVPFVILTNRKEQPAVLFWLFMVELWERFSYYGMRAFLVLYLTKSLVTGGFGLKKEVAYGVYAAYGALVYLTPLIGGFLADKIMGFRRAIIWGAILMAAGQFTLFTSPGTDLIPQSDYKVRADKWAEDRGHKATLEKLKGLANKWAEAQRSKSTLDAQSEKQWAEYAGDPALAKWARETLDKIAPEVRKDKELANDPDLDKWTGKPLEKLTDRLQEEFLGKEAQLLDQEIAAGRTAGGGTEILLFIGLALLVVGNGFFKPNISSMIGRFYPQGDPRRDRAFTIFYMGINTGAFIAPLTCGYVAETQGWRYGFLLAGIGMVTGLMIFLYASSRGILQNYADPPPDAPKTVGPLPAMSAVYLGTFLLVPLAAVLIYQNDIVDILLGSIGLLVVVYMMYLSFQYPTEERQRIWVIVILLFFTTVFWGFFELAGSALNVFTDENVDKRVFGSEIPASVFQAVNAFFIMVFAPVFTLMWGYLSKKGIEPAAPVKFAIGLLLLGLGFLVLNLGKGAAVAGIVPLIFLILLYLLHTLGELALSPVGLSLVTKLAPAKIVGFMMGFWFLSSAIAHQAGKWIAGAMAVDSKAPAEVRLETSLEVFNQVGLFALGCGVLLLILSPIIRRWMHGIR
jgi:POT family proton-dependent oligopeptide transporter